MPSAQHLTFVRAYAAATNRSAIHGLTEEAITFHKHNRRNRLDDTVKIVCTLPKERLSTITAPRDVVRTTLLIRPRPHNQARYDLVRSVGWLALAMHVMCLCLISPANQLVFVAVVLSATAMVAKGMGRCMDDIAGNCSYYGPDSLHLDWTEAEADSESICAPYPLVGLNPDEEERMVVWGLFPPRSNETWWQRYGERGPRPPPPPPPVCPAKAHGWDKKNAPRCTFL